jgi:hypothetical protein
MSNKTQSFTVEEVASATPYELLNFAETMELENISPELMALIRAMRDTISGLTDSTKADDELSIETSAKHGKVDNV